MGRMTVIAFSPTASLKKRVRLAAILTASTIESERIITLDPGEQIKLSTGGTPAAEAGVFSSEAME